jgi:cysteine desulfurase/selenocysteine lyase
MAMAEAFKYIKKIGFDQILGHDRKLLKVAYEKLEDVKGLELYGPPAEKRVNTITFNIQGIKPTEVAKMLDSSHKIAVRSGHLCAQILTKEVLCVEEGLVRASTYFYNKEEELDTFAESTKNIVYSKA